MTPSEPGASGLNVEFRMVKSIAKLDEVFKGLNDQKSETCGPYSILKISRAILDIDENELTEDYLAQLSGTTISMEEESISSKYRGKDDLELDPEVREMFYPLKMKVSEKDEELGTSAIGVFRAAEKVFSNNYEVRPFFAYRNNELNFSEVKFDELSNILWENIQKIDLNAILNVQVDLLCSNSNLKTPVDLLSFLSQSECHELDDWSVGHFVILAGMARVYSDRGTMTYYILQENYKNRGMSGYLFQQSEMLRRALVRNDGKEGGIILIYPSSESGLDGLFGRILSTGTWDNGTPFPEE